MKGDMSRGDILVWCFVVLVVDVVVLSLIAGAPPAR